MSVSVCWGGGRIRLAQLSASHLLAVTPWKSNRSQTMERNDRPGFVRRVCVCVCFPFKDPNEPLSMSVCRGAWLLMIGCLCYQAID